ncbi:hypothetical protein [Nonomuraea sp. 10N515B]|uniref:hypothetical protein n=1 Tax=Nonomuraea sp. 10N515B TaxID=3457422 RepID=UPI003FCC6C5E
MAGYGVLEADLALLPFAASSAMFNMAGATLGRRFNNRAMVTTCMLIIAAGSVCCRRSARQAATCCSPPPWWSWAWAPGWPPPLP